MADKEGITGQLKAADQMAWVVAMNNIRNRATEIVNAELIYLQDEGGSILFATAFYIFLKRKYKSLFAIYS